MNAHCVCLHLNRDHAWSDGYFSCNRCDCRDFAYDDFDARLEAAQEAFTADTETPA